MGGVIGNSEQESDKVGVRVSKWVSGQVAECVSG